MFIKLSMIYKILNNYKYKYKVKQERRSLITSSNVNLYIAHIRATPAAFNADDTVLNVSVNFEISEM